MKENSIDIQEVRKYLLNQLPEEERYAIDKKLKEDPDFSEEFNLMKSIAVGMEEHYDEVLKEKLKKEDLKKEDTKTRVLRPKRYVSLLVAASIALLFIVSYFFLNNSHEVNSQQLYAQYYKPYYNVIDDYTRGDSTDEGNLSQSFRLYEQRNYKAAIQVFEKDLMKNPHDTAALFYLGLSYLADEAPEQALPILQQLAGTSHIFNSTAAWYTGLAFLKKNDLEQARSLFENISRSESSYKQKALSIVEELN